MQKRIFCLFYAVLVMFLCVINIYHCIMENSIGSLILNAESTIQAGIPGKKQLRELYGITNCVISPYEIASEGGATVKDKDGFLEKISYVSYDIREAERNIFELKKVCEDTDTDFVFVSYPSKTNARTTPEYYGIETNGEETRNNFLNGLKSGGVNILNVRTLLEEAGYQVKDIFYKTDHHWKSTSGLFCARAIVNYLNDTFDYHLRADLLDESQFDFITHEKIWFGEEGRKLSKTWVGALDDFTEIRPVYETLFSVKAEGAEEKRKGDFSIFIDDSGYDGNVNLYQYSAHYSYLNSDSQTKIHNHCVESEKILIIKDSYSVVVIPFLSLSASDVTVWDMRTNKEGLYDYIKQNDFDAVLLAYTDFWREDMYQFN